TRYQDQNGKATLKLEAWAYDRANNLGKAKPITVYVDNQPNATPMRPDPAKPAPAPEAGLPMTGRSAASMGEVTAPGLVGGAATPQAAGIRASAPGAAGQPVRMASNRVPQAPEIMGSGRLQSSASLSPRGSAPVTRDPIAPPVEARPVRMASAAVTSAP